MRRGDNYLDTRRKSHFRILLMAVFENRGSSRPLYLTYPKVDFWTRIGL